MSVGGVLGAVGIGSTLGAVGIGGTLGHALLEFLLGTAQVAGQLRELAAAEHHESQDDDQRQFLGAEECEEWTCRERNPTDGEWRPQAVSASAAALARAR